jgi:hypothetical protein
MHRRLVSVALSLVITFMPLAESAAASKVKVRGYITARPDAQTLQILDDVIHLAPGTEFQVENPNSAVRPSLEELTPGTLIEVEGTWQGKHNFAAQKITCDAAQFDKHLHGAAYLDRDPAQAAEVAAGRPALMQADGEILLLEEGSRREWKTESPGVVEAAATTPARPRFAGRQVRWDGVRKADGNIAAERLELAAAAPAEAYKNPDNVEVVRAQDLQTKIDILEFRHGKKVIGRMKLFPVRAVQEYVTDLGRSLLPPSADVTARALEFRFFVVEDPHINAASLPDGTILVNTGLLASVENEATLAFVLSHEITHVLQAHYWREVHETRSKRVLITVAAIAGAYFVGDVAIFLGTLGLASVVNGYSRNIEDQADRIGLQNIIERGYDPRAATAFFRIMIERYGDRSTSAVWSSHENSLMRGSFLTAQLSRQYPGTKFDSNIITTRKFTTMKDDLGFIKIM